MPHEALVPEPDVELEQRAGEESARRGWALDETGTEGTGCTEELEMKVMRFGIRMEGNPRWTLKGRCTQPEPNPLDVPRPTAWTVCPFDARDRVRRF
jgi:hypothetical protein